MGCFCIQGSKKKENKNKKNASPAGYSGKAPKRKGDRNDGGMVFMSTAAYANTSTDHSGGGGGCGGGGGGGGCGGGGGGCGGGGG